MRAFRAIVLAPVLIVLSSGVALAQTPIDPSVSPELNTGGWVHASVDFTTGPKQTIVELGPRVGFNEWRPTGTAWFADLSLVEVEATAAAR